MIHRTRLSLSKATMKANYEAVFAWRTALTSICAQGRKVSRYLSAAINPPHELTRRPPPRDYQLGEWIVLGPARRSHMTFKPGPFHTPHHRVQHVTTPV